MAIDVSELRATLEKLAAVNERRANLIEYRDRQIADAVSRGATWAQMQDVTGLSPRGLALALKRHRTE